MLLNEPIKFIELHSKNYMSIYIYINNDLQCYEEQIHGPQESEVSVNKRAKINRIRTPST